MRVLNNAYKTSRDYSRLRELLLSGKNIVVFMGPNLALMYRTEENRQEYKNVHGENLYRFYVDDTISLGISFHDFDWKGNFCFDTICRKYNVEFIDTD